MGYLINIKKLNHNPALKTYFKSLKRHYVWLYCRICGKKDVFRVNNKSLYTKNVKNNYICLRCKGLEKFKKFDKIPPNLFNYAQKF